jgi:hypothetical protein
MLPGVQKNELKPREMVIVTDANDQSSLASYRKLRKLAEKNDLTVTIVLSFVSDAPNARETGKPSDSFIVLDLLSLPDKLDPSWIQPKGSAHPGIDWLRAAGDDAEVHSWE